MVAIKSIVVLSFAAMAVASPILDKVVKVTDSLNPKQAVNNGGNGGKTVNSNVVACGNNNSGHVECCNTKGGQTEGLAAIGDLANGLFQCSNFKIPVAAGVLGAGLSDILSPQSMENCKSEVHCCNDAGDNVNQNGFVNLNAGKAVNLQCSPIDVL